MKKKDAVLVKIDKVSKTKTHITCEIPVYMTGYDKPVDNLTITLRYRRVAKLRNKEYRLVRRSIDMALESFSRRERVGSVNSFSRSSKVVDIKPIYKNIIIDDYTYDMVKYIMVDDRSYLSNVRDKKLQKNIK